MSITVNTITLSMRFTNENRTSIKIWVITSCNKSIECKFYYLCVCVCVRVVRAVREWLTAELGGLRGGDGLAEHGVQLDDLLVLDAAHVRRVGVGARARHVAQLAAQRRRARRAPRQRRRAGRRQLHGRLLLLVLLALQVLLVRLRTQHEPSMWRHLG